MRDPANTRPDPSEGINRVEDLPTPKIRVQSRKLPAATLSALWSSRLPRWPGRRRTLHDLGNPFTDDPAT